MASSVKGLREDPVLNPKGERAEAGPKPTMAPERFREVAGHFASGVTVVTTSSEGRPFGTTANAVSSLSLEPPMMVVCLNQESETGRAVAVSGNFAVNILTEEQTEVAHRFAVKGGDKFAGLEVEEGLWGAPLIAGALARIECRVAEEVLGGTHVVLLGEVARAEAAPGSPLAYFRGKFGKLQLS